MYFWGYQLRCKQAFYCVVILFTAFVSFSRDFLLQVHVHLWQSRERRYWLLLIDCEIVLQETKEEHALITQNFLPQAETTPPVFAANVQILGGPIGYGGGKTQSPCPQLKQKAVVSPTPQRGAVLWGGQAGRAVVGHLCSWASPALHGLWGFGLTMSTLWKIAPLCYLFDL